MAEVKDVVVPDIGDFSDVPIIEVMVSPGDTVAAEDPLVTLESDKATMDVPAPFGGVVQELKVKTGDTVSEGSPLLTLQVDGDQPAAAEGGNGASAAGVTTPAPEAGSAEPIESAIQAEESAAERPPRHRPRRRRPQASARAPRLPAGPSTPARAPAVWPASSASISPG
jgi:pyruvate/2-oxoglutarate dehydrogenase complex dihydrolipoamide acyltransferase (E2) component